MKKKGDEYVYWWIVLYILYYILIYSIIKLYERQPLSVVLFSAETYPCAGTHHRVSWPLCGFPIVQTFNIFFSFYSKFTWFMRSRITGPANVYVYYNIVLYIFFSLYALIIKYRRRVFAQSRNAFAGRYKYFGTAVSRKQRVHYEQNTAARHTYILPPPTTTTVCFKIKKDRFIFIQPRSVLHAIIIRLEMCLKK